MSKCVRCGVPAVVSLTTNSKAKVLKRAHSSEDALCANCAMTAFIKHTPTLMAGINKHGARMLLNPVIQDGFAGLLRVTNSDAEPSEIDWQRVVDNWDLEEIEL